MVRIDLAKVSLFIHIMWVHAIYICVAAIRAVAAIAN